MLGVVQLCTIATALEFTSGSKSGSIDARTIKSVVRRYLDLNSMEQVGITLTRLADSGYLTKNTFGEISFTEEQVEKCLSELKRVFDAMNWAQLSIEQYNANCKIKKEGNDA